MRRWILRVEDEAAYNDARTAAQIREKDLVIVTLSMSVTLIETEGE